MNVLFVPSIGLDVSLLERLAASVDYPVKFKVALNNGPLGALDKFRDKHPDWIVKDTGSNMGVAGSWNYCAKWWSSEPAWLIMNEDAWFLPGYLEKMCKASDLHVSDTPIVYLNESRAFYCFVWHAFGRNLIGDFDENLWPAYYEDCDYRVRINLARRINSTPIICPYALPGLPPLPHGKPRTGGTDYAAMLQGCGLLNRAYWRRKWGSDNYEQATFQTPYRDHRLTVKDWVWNPQHRAELWPLWRAFIEQPEPSIYD